MPQKMRPQLTKSKGKRTKQWPIEAEFDLATGKGSSPNLISTSCIPEGWLYWFTQQFASSLSGRYGGLMPVEREAQQALDAQALTFRRLTRNVIRSSIHQPR